MTRIQCLMALSGQYQRPRREALRMTNQAYRGRPYGVVYPTLAIAVWYRGFNDYEIARCVRVNR